MYVGFHMQKEALFAGLNQIGRNSDHGSSFMTQLTLFHNFFWKEFQVVSPKGDYLHGPDCSRPLHHAKLSHRMVERVAFFPCFQRTPRIGTFSQMTITFQYYKLLALPA
jgi:hypothetical protein